MTQYQQQKKHKSLLLCFTSLGLDGRNSVILSVQFIGLFLKISVKVYFQLFHF